MLLRSGQDLVQVVGVRKLLTHLNIISIKVRFSIRRALTLKFGVVAVECLFPQLN
jgi:hypothetical protein